MPKKKKLEGFTLASEIPVGSLARNRVLPNAGLATILGPGDAYPEIVKVHRWADSQRCRWLARNVVIVDADDL